MNFSQSDKFAGLGVCLKKLEFLITYFFPFCLWCYEKLAKKNQNVKFKKIQTEHIKTTHFTLFEVICVVYCHTQIGIQYPDVLQPKQKMHPENLYFKGQFNSHPFQTQHML